VAAITGKRYAEKRRALYYHKIVHPQTQFFFIGFSKPVIIFAKIAERLVVCLGAFFTCRAFRAGSLVEHQTVPEGEKEEI
jgi:hypothetical protein